MREEGGIWKWVESVQKVVVDSTEYVQFVVGAYVVVDVANTQKTDLVVVG